MWEISNLGWSSLSHRNPHVQKTGKFDQFTDSSMLWCHHGHFCHTTAVELWEPKAQSFLSHQSIQQLLSGGCAQEEPFTRHLVFPETVLSTFMPPCLCLCCYFCLRCPLPTAPSGKVPCILQILLNGSLMKLPLHSPSTNLLCGVSAFLLLLHYSLTWLRPPRCNVYSTGPNVHSLSYQTQKSWRSKNVPNLSLCPKNPAQCSA